MPPHDGLRMVTSAEPFLSVRTVGLAILVCVFSTQQLVEIFEAVLACD